jgi:hypothetical protein
MFGPRKIWQPWCNALKKACYASDKKGLFVLFLYGCKNLIFSRFEWYYMSNMIAVG